MMFEEKETARGFKLVEFKDLNSENCSLQESSSVEPSVWLGVDGDRMHLKHEQARRLATQIMSFVQGSKMHFEEISKETANFILGQKDSELEIFMLVQGKPPTKVNHLESIDTIADSAKLAIGCRWHRSKLDWDCEKVVSEYFKEDADSIDFEEMGRHVARNLGYIN